MAVGQISDRKEIPAFVRFERRPMQDHAASLAAGKYVERDVDWALITPPYSKDCHETKVETWLKQMEADVRNDRLPAEWRDKYVDLYERFKKGEELPLDGTPIKGWGVISPAQQSNLIHAGIPTVEMLAGINDEGVRRVGMGAVDLKNKAVAWLAQLNDKGPLTMEVADLKRQIAIKDGEIGALTKKVELLTNEVRSSQLARQLAPVSDAPAEPGIQASDIMPDTI